MHGEQREPMAYTQQISPQYYDSVGSYMPSQAQYISSAYLPQQPAPQQHQQKQQPQQRKVDDRNNYFYASQQQQQQRDFQEPLYGYPTFHGDYDPKPYYFAQPSYLKQEDRMETTNPLDYLQAEIFQENERERNNAAFMKNLALYNQKLDSLQARQQKLQQFENMYNLKPLNEFDDYEMEQQPSDWYDQTSILVDPNPLDNYLSSASASDPQFQYQQWQPHSSDYDDEMVKELRELKEMKQQNKNSASNKKKSKQQKQQQQQKDSYRNLDWQRDMPQTNNNEDEEVMEPENYDDEWINWSGQKRSIQPKKVISDVKQTPQSTAAPSLITQKSKILEKLQSKITAGQKEVVLPRPATPVRRPFSEAVMKSMGKVSMGEKVSESEESSKSDQQTLPIYKTIKQIIDMEQNLSHVSRIFFIKALKVACTLDRANEWAKNRKKGKKKLKELSKKKERERKQKLRHKIIIAMLYVELPYLWKIIQL